MGTELLLNGQCAYPEVLLTHGFMFKYENIHQALKNILLDKTNYD
jgi:NAD dependent epimerase/dehydratase family enzyme